MTNETQPPSSWLLPAVLTLVFWGLWGFLPKIVLQTLPPESVLFYESLGNFLIALPLFVHFRFRLKTDARGVGICGLSAVISVIAVLFLYIALRQGPASVVVTLTSLYSIVAVTLAWMFLKEKISRLQMLSILLSLVSIALLAS